MVDFLRSWTGTIRLLSLRNWLAPGDGQGTGWLPVMGKELAGSRRWARNWYLGPSKESPGNFFWVEGYRITLIRARAMAMSRSSPKDPIQALGFWPTSRFVGLCQDADEDGGNYNKYYRANAHSHFSRNFEKNEKIIFSCLQRGFRATLPNVLLLRRSIETNEVIFTRIDRLKEVFYDVEKRNIHEPLNTKFFIKI